jgi:hypothetical protein
MFWCMIYVNHIRSWWKEVAELMFLSSSIFSRVLGLGEEDLENNMDSTEYECQWRNNAQHKCQNFRCFQCLLNPFKCRFKHRTIYVRDFSVEFWRLLVVYYYRLVKPLPVMSCKELGWVRQCTQNNGCEGGHSITGVADSTTFINKTYVEKTQFGHYYKRMIITGWLLYIYHVVQAPLSRESNKSCLYERGFAP